MLIYARSDNLTCVSERLSSYIFTLKYFRAPHGNRNYNFPNIGQTLQPHGTTTTTMSERGYFIFSMSYIKPLK